MKMAVPEEDRKLKVLQISVGTSRPAQGLALVQAKKLGAEVICMTEPHLYKGCISPTPGWKAIATSRAAILISNAVQTPRLEKFEDHVTAHFGTTTIISSYLSPN